MRGLKSLITKVRNRAFAPVDIASLVFFRIAFGLLMTWEVWRYYSNGLIAAYWIEPRFLFKFYGFSWVHPWSDYWLYIHWAVLGILAVFIAAGFFYRISTLLFFLSYTYFFLLDQGRYVNHTYLICLFSFLLILVPAHRAFSIDSWLNPKIRSQTTPAWTLWLLRTQMGVVYVFGGLAKLAPDWLHGEPMRTWLGARTDFPIIGRFFREEWAAYAASYFALLFDLLIVPFLIWRRTRVAAFCVAMGFHLLNNKLFIIDSFPWFAIAATTLFLSPSWPRLIASKLRLTQKPVLLKTADELPFPWKRRLILSLVALYMAIQILVPLRQYLCRGGIEWTYMEHRFSWQMMLRRAATRTFFYATDPNVGSTFRASPRTYLKESQIMRMSWRPDMIVQFAHYLATVMPRRGPKPLKVEARVLVSLNGRQLKLFLDPNVDLAAEIPGWGRPRWLFEIHEPLPPREKEFTGDPVAPLPDQ